MIRATWVKESERPDEVMVRRKRSARSSARGGGHQRNIIVLEREDVMVHVPASATATSSVTQAVTMVAANSSGTATAVNRIE